MGGDIRSKNGLGVVESEHETFMKQGNPREVLALREVRSLARTFSRGDFTSAMTIALELSRYVTRKEKFYAGITDLVRAYALWHAFDRKGTLGKLRQALGRLEPFAVNHEALFKANLAVLEDIQQDGQCLRASKAPLPERSGTARSCAACWQRGKGHGSPSLRRPGHPRRSAALAWRLRAGPSVPLHGCRRQGQSSRLDGPCP